MQKDGRREELQGTEVRGTVEELETLGLRKNALAIGFVICGLLAYAFYGSWEKAPVPLWVPVLWVMFIALVVGAGVCYWKFEPVHEKYKALERKIRFNMEHPY